MTLALDDQSGKITKEHAEKVCLADPVCPYVGSFKSSIVYCNQGKVTLYPISQPPKCDGRCKIASMQ